MAYERITNLRQREEFARLVQQGLRDPNCDWCYYGEADGTCSCESYKVNHYVSQIMSLRDPTREEIKEILMSFAGRR